MKRGDTILWHAVRGDKIVKIYSILEDMLFVIDSNGLRWVANKNDVEKGGDNHG